jgi:hypothetical protein
MPGPPPGRTHSSPSAARAQELTARINRRHVRLLCLLHAGMGDAMATHYEAQACARNPQAYTWMHPLTHRPPLIAAAIGEVCLRTLYELVRDCWVLVLQSGCMQREGVKAVTAQEPTARAWFATPYTPNPPNPCTLCAAHT